MRAFTARELKGLVTAFASLDFRSDDVLLAVQVTPLLPPPLPPGRFARLALLQCPSPPHPPQDEAARRPGDFSPRDAALLVRAYANLQHPAPTAMLDALAASAAERIEEFGGRELAILLRGYAALGHRSPELMDAATARLAGKGRGGADSLTPASLVNIAWAFGSLHVRSSKAMRALAEAAAPKVRGMKNWEGGAGSRD